VAPDARTEKINPLFSCLHLSVALKLGRQAADKGITNVFSSLAVAISKISMQWNVLSSL
jgi:hypothetical protein